MIRRYGEIPERGRRYILRPGAYAILPRGGELLVTFQAEPDPEIQLPGGGIDPGESPLAALYREAREETGWTIAHPRFLCSYRRFVFMPDYDMFAEKLCHIFMARPVRRISQPTEDGHTALFLPTDDALRVLKSEGDAAAVSDALSMGFIS